MLDAARRHAARDQAGCYPKAVPRPHPICALDGAVLFRALFPLAVADQGSGTTAPAAYLLLVLEPPCDLACEEALKWVLPDWDISMEEVPLYLVTQFGKRELRRAVNVLAREPTLSETERVRLETILYWIDFPALELMGWVVRASDDLLKPAEGVVG